MNVKVGETCSADEGGLSLKGDASVAAEASRFESLLKEAFGVPKDRNVFSSIFRADRAALPNLGREEARLDNNVHPLFRNAVYEQVAQDLLKDPKMPAIFRMGLTAPYLSIANKIQDAGQAALPELDVVMEINCRR